MSYSSMTMEQMEAAEYGVPHRLPKRVSKTSTTGGENSNLKLLKRVLEKAKIRISVEHGEFWFTYSKVDAEELCVSLKKKVTRKDRRELKTLKADNLPITEFYGSIGWNKYHGFYVNAYETYLFNCNKQDIEKLPEFLKTYFSSKYTKGIINLKSK